MSKYTTTRLAVYPPGEGPAESTAYPPIPKRKRGLTAVNTDEMRAPIIEEWDPRSLPDGFFVVLEGKRRTGKTTYAKWMLQWYQHKFNLVWVMSQTSLSGFWQRVVGDDFVFPKWNPAAIQSLIDRNDKIIAHFGEDSDETRKRASALIILDDCITNDIWNSDILKRLAVEGRHHHISVLFLTQDPKTIRPLIRDNTDVAIIFNQKTYRNKESMWMDFINDVDRKTAMALMRAYCNNHDALVCVQTNLTPEIRRNFFKSTGDKRVLRNPHYTLGGPSQKKAAERRAQASRATIAPSVAPSVTPRG